VSHHLWWQISRRRCPGNDVDLIDENDGGWAPVRRPRGPAGHCSASRTRLAERVLPRTPDRHSVTSPCRFTRKTSVSSWLVGLWPGPVDPPLLDQNAPGCAPMNPAQKARAGTPAAPTGPDTS
jgi:hypothetical protein